MDTMAIIIACGKEEEIAPGTEAAFLTLGNRPMIAHSLRVLELSPEIDSVVLVVSKERVESAVQVIKRYGCTKVCGVVVGGVNRLSSLRTVFGKIKTEPSVVVVHEASRPFISQKLLAETVKCAKRYGCAIAAHKLPDAVKVAPKGMRVTETLDRNTAWVAQTPQVFKASVLKKIIDPKNLGVKVVDDESEFIDASSEVHLVEAGSANIKIRERADLGIATALMNAQLTDVESN
ncbi:2-C-methyl-D-erythritol 4-phosphate cytidylyltransferase, partial [Pontiella sp.]|uniref:IspD/TarI family cytidylyltransferase n=1 Tax=Pontiella sp. TaxID=2837462 RepID=UPI003569D76A